MKQRAHMAGRAAYNWKPPAPGEDLLLGDAREDSWDPVPRGNRVTTVYLCCAANRSLLYVGITGTQNLQRFAQHAATKAWWKDVAFILTEQFALPADARRREEELIRTRKPAYNVVFSMAGERCERGCTCPKHSRKRRRRAPRATAPVSLPGQVCRGL